MKKIFIFFIIFSTFISQSSAYVLSNNVFLNYETELDKNKITIQSYSTSYNTSLNVISDVNSQYGTGELLLEMNNLYQSAFSEKEQFVTLLNDQKNQIDNVLQNLETKYQEEKITLNDYGIIKNRIISIKNEINTLIVGIGGISEYGNLYNLLINNIGNKLVLLNNIIPQLNSQEIVYNTKSQEFLDAFSVFKVTKTSEDLEVTIEKLENFNSLVREDSAIGLSIKSIKNEIIAINGNLNSIKNNINDFKQRIQNITNIDFVTTDLLTELNSTIDIKETEKSEIDAMFSTLSNPNLTDNREKMANSIFKDYLSKVKNLGTVQNGNNLQKVNLKVPNSGYLSELTNQILQTSNQNKFKSILGDIKNNKITNEGIEILPYSNTGVTNKITLNKEITNLLTYESSFSLNTFSNLVSKIKVSYNDKNGNSISKTLSSKIDINELNLRDANGDFIDSSQEPKDLNGIYFLKDQYYIDFKLYSRDSKNTLTTTSNEESPKDIIISIINSSGDNYYSEKIQDVKDINYIEVENLGGLKLNYNNVTDDYTIDYNLFTKTLKDKILFNNYAISFVGYSDNSYKDLEASINGEFLNSVSNILSLTNGRKIGTKTGDVKVKLNNEDTTKTITYTLLDSVNWDKNTKVMKSQYKNYTIEKNVIIDPLIKKYFDTTKEISFDEKVGDIRDVLTIGDKIEKVTRLQDSNGKIIVEEFRYFDSTQNYNSTLDDTTGQVLVFFKVNEIISEGNPLKGINRIENVYYKVGLNENYGKVVVERNKNTLIPISGDLDDELKPGIVTIDAIMKYKVFTDYRFYFDKQKYLDGDIKNAIRYTQIYKDDKFSFKYVKLNGVEVGSKGENIEYLDTKRN